MSWFRSRWAVICKNKSWIGYGPWVLMGAWPWYPFWVFTDAMIANPSWACLRMMGAFAVLGAFLIAGMLHKANAEFWRYDAKEERAAVERFIWGDVEEKN